MLKKFEYESTIKTWLRPSLKSISIRLPEDMLAELKTIANKKDVPYQSLAKIYLARQIALERGFFRSTQKKRSRKTDVRQTTWPDLWKAAAFQKRLSFLFQKPNLNNTYESKKLRNHRCVIFTPEGYELKIKPSKINCDIQIPRRLHTKTIILFLNCEQYRLHSSVWWLPLRQSSKGRILLRQRRKSAVPLFA